MGAEVSTGSNIIDRGRPPEEWVAELAQRGFEVSERTLRERANKLGACHRLGRAMLITPAHMDMILGENRKCHSSRTPVERSGGPRAASNTSASRSQTTTDAALERLKLLARGSGAAPKKSGKSAGTSSATKNH